MTKKNIKSTHGFCFRRWSRASYAIFNSLHSVVKMGVISVSCSFLSLCFSSLSAQVTNCDTLSEKEFLLDEVVIGESRTSVFIAPQQIAAVISRDEIERAGVETLQDLLLYIQGVDLRTRGNNGIQADVSLRGCTFDQSIVLINGINLTDPQTGHFSLHIPIIVEAIERIEVLEGPGTMAYNTLAFGGCINIITRTSEKNIFDLSLQTGMYGYIRAAALTHLHYKKWYLTIGGDINRSEGFTDNTDYQQGNAFVRLLYKNRKTGTFDVQCGYQEKQFGANSFYSAKYKEQYEHIRTRFVGVDHTLTRKAWRVNTNLYLRQHFDRFELFRYESPSWYGGHNYHKTVLGGINLQAARNYNRGNTAIGLDYRQENIWSTNLGEPLENPISIAGESDSLFYLKAGTRKHAEFQLQQNFLWKNAKTSLGFRGSYCENYGFNWNLATNTVWYFRKNIELNYFVENVYRLPTFTDLYYTSATQTGNPDLQPEKAIVASAGISWNPQQWKLGLNIFYRYGFQIIDWVRLSLEENWFCQNLTHIQATGTDISVTFFPKNKYLSQIGIQYNYLYVSKNSRDYLSLYATDYLRNQIKLNIHHTVYWKIYADWQFNFQDRAGTYLDFLSNTEQRYKPYLLCNLKISLLLEKTRVFVEATNLFNRKYFDLGNIPQPGIWIKGGVVVNVF
ncbi:MAG: TonB-dependent receptor [Bacteroidales bacterium]|jgi:iron complex outermembrane receptor protein|nr:TonB-dependent receptor [Bacteroidales bacterium]